MCKHLYKDVKVNTWCVIITFTFHCTFLRAKTKCTVNSSNVKRLLLVAFYKITKITIADVLLYKVALEEYFISSFILWKSQMVKIVFVGHIAVISCLCNSHCIFIVTCKLWCLCVTFMEYLLFLQSKRHRALFMCMPWDFCGYLLSLLYAMHFCQG